LNLNLLSMKFFTLILGVVFCFSSFSSRGQSWQWIERAGGLFGSTDSQAEVPVDMTTDNAGNIYTVARVYPNGLATVGNEPISPLESNASNFVLISYTCDGEYRWSKTIGSSAGASPKAIRTDNDGNVYGVARIYSQLWNPGQFDGDLDLPVSEKSLYIYKYDSLGTLQWVVSPLADTISFINAHSNSYYIDLHVKGNGDFTLFCLLPAGPSVGGALNFDEPTPVALDYNSNGEFQTAVELPIEINNVSSFDFSFWCNKMSNGNIIMNGYSYYPNIDSLYIADEYIERAFLTCLNPEGELIWQHEFHPYDPLYSNGMFLGRPVVDDDNSVYVTGGVSHLDTLAGHVFENALSADITSMPMIAKFNQDGELLWAQNAMTNGGTIAFSAAKSGNTVVSAGKYPGIVRWQDADTELHHVVNQGYDPFFAMFDAQTGEFLMQDSLAGSFATYEEIYCVEKMPGGNYAFAGYFPYDLITPDDTLVALGAGDCFFGKFGDELCTVEQSTLVEQTFDGNNMLVFPNPFENNIRVQADIQPQSWTIYNMQGDMVWHKRSTDVDQDLSFLESGLYMLQVTDAINRNYKCRVVKID
jgi:Secretion system C-terminal sorting domain